MQFTAVVLLTLLMLKLLLLPRRVAVNPVAGTARWLMVVGIILLDIQFLLQFSLGLRDMGVTQAVLVNLVLFIPASWTMSLAVICLQQQGRVSRIDKLVGGVVWTVALVLLGMAVAIDGQPLLSDSPELHWAEVTASVCYLAMQGHYVYKQIVNLRSMRSALQDYYDSDMDDMLRWMKLSVMVLMVLAVMVPLFIFVESKGLALFGILFFGGIFFLVDSFCGYVASSSLKKVSVAEENRDREDEERSCIDGEQSTSSSVSELTADVLQHVEGAVNRWIDHGGYRLSGVNMPSAAEAIGIPRYQLSAWLRHKGLTYANWMTDLRIEEAQRVIKEHPDWSNEAVSVHCGFTDRTYFQRKFKEKTGFTPSKYSHAEAV